MNEKYMSMIINNECSLFLQKLIAENQTLIAENQTHKQAIASLTTNNSQLIQESVNAKRHIDVLNLNVDQLRQEKEHQTQVIEQLKEENEQLKKENKIMKKELDQLIAKYASLESKHSVLEMNFNAYVNTNKNKQSALKMMIALQDVNSQYKLESKIHQLHKLRGARVNECHYIIENDSDDEKNHKISIIYQKIKEIDPEVKKICEKNIGKGLIDKIREHLENHLPKTTNPLTTEQIENCEYWWEG